MELVEAKPAEGLGATYQNIRNLCQHCPTTLDLLDKAVKGKQGQRTDLKPNLVNNVHEVERPPGTSQQAGLRKLRKHSEGREDVAEAYKRVLAGEISVNKALANNSVT
jgi:hypothetical protein